MKLRQIVLLGLISSTAAGFYLGDKLNPQGPLVSPISYQTSDSGNQPSSQPRIESYNFDDTALSKIIQQDLVGKDGNYAIVVESLKPGSLDRYYYNDHQVFPAASLYKLFLLATAYDQIEQGKLTIDEQLTGNIPHLIDVLGAPEFGYDDVEGDSITYSVSQTMQRIATVSDNYAAVMLAERVGWDNVQAEAEKIGATSTTIQNPISTSAYDIDLYFRKLYAGQIVSRQSSDQIIDLLSQDQINDRIPASLPQSLKIAHKTGELSEVRHDAGIVYLEGNPYIIVLMSKDLTYEDDAVATLAQISDDVYNYFKNK